MRIRLAIATLGLSARIVSAQSPTFDVILRHGTILDGIGAAHKGDVGIVGNSIAQIGDLSAAHAPLELDVRGLFVAPGFINIHSHAETEALPTAVNMLTQGVTTEIVNADGGGEAHVAEQLRRGRLRESVRQVHSEGKGEYFNTLLAGC